MIASLKTGRVAAALLNPPYNFLAYREGLNNFGFSGNFVRLPSTGIATLGETLERSPDQVRRLTRAIARARAFAKDNKARDHADAQARAAHRRRRSARRKSTINTSRSKPPTAESTPL